MTETAGQRAEATETGDDVFGLGHAPTLRFVRKNVNADCVSVSVLRVMRTPRPAMDAMDYPKALRELRERAGFKSMAGFAKALGLAGASSIQRYEEDGNYPDGIPLNHIQRILPIFLERGIQEAEVLALAGKAGELIRGDADLGKSLKNIDEIPITRLRVFTIALAEFQRDRAILLSPDDQGDALARICRWYEEEIAAGRESPDISVTEAKRFVSGFLGPRPL